MVCSVCRIIDEDLNNCDYSVYSFVYYTVLAHTSIMLFLLLLFYICLNSEMLIANYHGSIPKDVNPLLLDH